MKNVIKAVLIGLIASALLGCGASLDSSTGTGHTPIWLSGKAALGAYFPDGSLVELRGAAAALAVSGPSGTTQAGTGPLMPSQVVQSTVQGSQGEYTIDVAGLNAPYLIRVQDALSGKWYYSYTDGTQLIANANPYTDMLVRTWYLYAAQIDGNPQDIQIDSIFESGVYAPGTCKVTDLSPPGCSGTLPDNTPFNLPDPVMMANANSVLSLTVAKAFNLDLENVLTGNWVAGIGFDALLDSVGVAQLQPVIYSSLDSSYYESSGLQSAVMYFEVLNTQVGSAAPSGSVQILADVVSKSTQITVADVRSGYGVHTPFSLSSTPTSDGYLDWTGSQTLVGLPAVDYQVTFDNNPYIATHITPIVYGNIGLNVDGSVASFTSGTGPTILSATGGIVSYSISDLTPIDVQIRAHGSSTVLFEKTYTRGASWTGSDTLSYDVGGAAFDLYIIGSNGERTAVQYSF